MDEAEQQRFERWRSGDARAAGAFIRAQAMYLQVDDIAQAQSFDLSRAPISRRSIMGWGGMAAVAAGTALLAPHLWPSQAHATQIGEIRRLPLSSGASVTLNTDSKVVISRNAGRDIVEVQRGEAYFMLTSVAARETDVLLNGKRLHATAGSFAVQKLGTGDGLITVQSGLVGVDDGSKIPAGTAFRMGISQSSAVVLPARDIDRRLMWLQGKLVFEGETLAEAVDDFARYGGPAIHVEGTQLANEPVAGLFASNDPDGFARAVAVALDARVEARGSALIIVR